MPINRYTITVSPTAFPTFALMKQGWQEWLKSESVLKTAAPTDVMAALATSVTPLGSDISPTSCPFEGSTRRK
jgi:hypothetical protein